MRRKVGSLAFFIAFVMATVWFSGGIVPVLSDLKKTAVAATESDEDLTITDDLNDIIIHNTSYKKVRMGPVLFTHTKHANEYGVSCWECHHEYDDKKNLWTPLGDTMNCVECHDPSEVQDDAPRLQTAYHLNCKGCHKQLALEHKKTGAFRKCLKCHARKEE